MENITLADRDAQQVDRMHMQLWQTFLLELVDPLTRYIAMLEADLL